MLTTINIIQFNMYQLPALIDAQACLLNRLHNLVSGSLISLNKLTMSVQWASTVYYQTK